MEASPSGSARVEPLMEMLRLALKMITRLKWMRRFSETTRKLRRLRRRLLRGHLMHRLLMLDLKPHTLLDIFLCPNHCSLRSFKMTMEQSKHLKKSSRFCKMRALTQQNLSSILVVVVLQRHTVSLLKYMRAFLIIQFTMAHGLNM